MSELRSMLADTVTRLFGDMSDSGNSEWAQVEALGLPSLLLDEASGGFNGQWQDAVLVAHLLGKHALALPLPETLIARWALHAAGHGELPGSAMGIAHCQTAIIATEAGGPRLTGCLRPATVAEGMPLVVSGTAEQGHFLALLEAGGNSPGFHQRQISSKGPAEIVLDDLALPELYWLDRSINLFQLAALLRCGQIAGSLEALVDMSVQYSSERKQFGRSISQFQVIQHSIAQLAAQAAAVSCAAGSAAQAVDQAGSSDTALVEIAAAKLRANMAIPHATRIAHQVHGAMGFTEEHRLHLFTRQLFAWRSEYGNDRYWSGLLGQWCLDTRSSGLWHSLTARSDQYMKPGDERGIDHKGNRGCDDAKRSA